LREQATGVAEVGPSLQGGSRGSFEDAALNMSHRDRAESIVDPPKLIAPVTLTLPRVEADDPVGDVVFSVLSVAVLRIAGTDPDARRGDPEGVHRLRTTTRRLRSELRALESLLDGRFREHLEEELKWLAGCLGGVRDLDILQTRLKKAADQLDQDGSSQAALAPFFAMLDSRREQAARSLNEALRSDRYRSLLASLERAAKRPALTDGASEPCRSVLPAVAADAWRRLKKQARALRPSDPDEEFHELRKRAKRARYTAELIAPIMGRRAARAAGGFIRVLTQIQDTLGEHQDAVIAALEIEHSLDAHRDDPPFVQAANSLIESEREKAEDARQSFFKVWDKLDRKKTRRWMKISPKVKAGA
jgi:CHAD domain-containing protein